MDGQRELRVGVIGAGPRGISLAERLLAHWNSPAGAHVHSGSSAAGSRLVIHLIDPYEPGPGHVWRTSQSRLYLMNTPALFPTAVPVGAPAEGIPPSPVPVSFDMWRALAARGGVPDLPAPDIAEIRHLGPAGFPSRALYGQYLRWLVARIREQAGAHAELIHHCSEAVALERVEDRVGAQYRILLQEDSALAVDAVVLALGHVPALLTPEQELLRDAAALSGLRYWPPAAPGDVDWDQLPAGEPALVRGLGLNFFDVMIQVTEGRGGVFASDADGRLEYHPSGREPVLVAASRRGVPYRAKAALDSYIPRGIRLRYCTPEAVAACATGGIIPGFDHDLWPLLHRDVLWAYYSTLARVRPAELTTAPEAALQRLRTALDIPGPDWESGLEAVLNAAVPPSLRLDVEALAHPFAGRKFADAGEYRSAVIRYLDEDAAASARGEDDPLKMAIGALNAGRSVLKQAVADGGITDASWITELRGWFEPLVEGLASGPPALRIAQLSALARAGVVRFVGPDPKFAADPHRGVFTAVSPWVSGEATARCLVEAMTPPNRVESSTSPLIRWLLEKGMARPRTMMLGEGLPVPSPGFDVSAPPYRLIGANGFVQENLYVLGLQLSSVQWGTAIAAEAGAPLDAGGRTLRDADQIARAIVSSA